MFDSIVLHATLPATDLARAKAWYADHLGLKPVEENEAAGGAWYRTGGVKFLLYESQFAGSNKATAASFATDDFDGAMDMLRENGVTFFDYDFGEIKTVDGVLTGEDGDKAAWFADSEGNILALSTT